MNRKIVFKSIAHGERKSLLLYITSLLISILIIQSSIIGIFGHGITESWFEALGFDGQIKEILAVNAAKVMAGICTAIWNFYTQRRFVFRSNSPKHN